MTDMDKKHAATTKVAREIAELLGDVVHTQSDGKFGYALFIFDFGENGSCSYMSSADRAGVLGMIKEWVARQEAGLYTDPPGEPRTA